MKTLDDNNAESGPRLHQSGCKTVPTLVIAMTRNYGHYDKHRWSQTRRLGSTLAAMLINHAV